MQGEKAHGRSQMAWCGNILEIRAQHAFNREGVEASWQQYSVLVQKRQLSEPQTPWARLAIVDDDALPTHDAHPLIKSSYVWSKQRGCVAAAIVSVHNLLFRQMFLDVGLCIGFFNDEVSARRWLEKQILNANASRSLKPYEPFLHSIEATHRTSSKAP